MMDTFQNQNSPQGIAIVGMAGRFPGAGDIDAFWKNLRNGVESITYFSDEELVAAGVDPDQLTHSRYVKARPVLADADRFDASFFGFTPAEAAHMDPQQRLFLECAWEALEHAGCDPERFDGIIGLYAGLNRNSYLLANLCTDLAFVQDFLDANKVGFFQTMLGNEKDFIATRAAFKLNLRGPAVTVQTACSTSLVAVNMACQSLLTHQCDAVLAGGVSVIFPQTKGYVYQEGGIESLDGHCRAFDAAADGTIFGSGLGLVVLKRLDDALASGDQIYAVIKGSAINNDGAAKVSYTAPGVEGQVEVVQLAQALAGVSPDSISYVEAHGTGTALGDSVEVSALTEAFRAGTDRKQFCALGSVKTNVGHLDVAAGITGLIKTALALHHRELPPSLHLEQPNPKLDLENSPFFVNTRLTPWERQGGPLRAAISSFGVGGTNAHAILEEAPPRPPSGPSRPWQLLMLSARNDAALERASGRLCDHLKHASDTDLADVAFTLQTGRREFPSRSVVLCRDALEAAGLLENPDPRNVFTGSPTSGDTPVVFMFPGQGCQYVGMGAELYETEPVFRAELDRCSEILRPLLGLDPRILFHPMDGATPQAEDTLRQTRFTQPVLFAFEYAVARLWMSWGVNPVAMIGHSVGEYVAACLAGVFTLDDALRIVVRRGQLSQECPTGAMLAVRLSESEVTPLLKNRLCIAAVNAPDLCVVSGALADIEAFEQHLRVSGQTSIRLRTSHAFHSHLMDPAVKPFADFLRAIPMQAPRIPYISNVTAHPIEDQQATSPEFWAAHLRQSVHFAAGLDALIKDFSGVLLEVGPGQTLGSLARHHPSRQPSHLIIPSLGTPQEPETSAILETLGKLWIAGVAVDWNGFYAHETRRRVPLPTYPFERQRHFIEAPHRSPSDVAVTSVTQPFSAAANESPKPLRPATADSATTLVFANPPVGGGSRRERLAADLHALFTELTGLELSAEDCSRSFLELGFDSLFLTQVRQQLETVFGIKITIGQLLDQVTTIDALTDYLDRELPFDGTPTPGETATSFAAAVQPPGKTFPLTDQQREIWLACQMGPEMSCAYNDSSTLTFRGAFDADALREALQQVIARHEGLRLTFAADGSGQQAIATSHLEIPLHDWSSRSEAEAREDLAAAVSAEMSNAFDLVRGPLVRAQIFRLRADEHALLIGAHHLVCDGWSWSVLLDELGQLYSARVHTRTCALPEPLAFGEFARRQENERAGAAYAAAETYWLKRFDELPPPLELPTDNPRTPQSGNRGAAVEIALERELVQHLRAVGAQHGATLFNVLLSALHVLLQRLSGQKKSVVAICSAGQTQPGADRVVGHCVNLLPIYSTSEDDPSFEQFVVTIKELMRAAFEHDNYTYGKLLEKLSIAREPGRPPLINAVLTLLPPGDLPFEGLECTEVTNPKSFVNFDVLFGIREAGSGFVIDVNYNRDLFAPDTVKRWLGHFHTLLENIALRPDTALSRLPLLDPTARQRLLTEWNDTAMAYPPVCLHALFEARVAEKPGAYALVVGKERLTYGELNRRANRVAHHLRALGVGPENLVGIFFERSADMVCALMGVLKAGGAYVPMDPAYPAERLAYILQDSRAHTVLTQEKLADTLHGFTESMSQKPNVVCVDTDTSLAAAEDSNPPPITRPEHLAYVLYTSGSTGRPKGVAIEHRNAVAFAQWAGVVFDAELDGVLASTSICFDLSVFELFVTLGHGGKIILAGNAFDLPSLPAAHEVRLIVSVPSIIREVLRMRGIPSSVSTVTLAGEPLPVDIVQQLHALPHIEKVWDLYGPTETTTYSTFALRDPHKPATIGRPIANTRTYLLDEHREPVPIGVVGELFIGGGGVARGYLNQPDLTSQKFIADPFTENPGERLYRTGDLCRYRADGNLDYIGRVDHQVKIHGFRIELGEIEAVLRTHPAVSDCAVVAPEEASGHKRILAYLTLRDAASFEPGPEFIANVLQHLGNRLPKPMLPENIVVLDRIPLTPNGKVDRNALPQPGPEAIPVASVRVAPRTPMEETLAGMWREILDHTQFGVHDDFFKLGGHSLLALRLIARVRNDLRIELPIRSVFQFRTIAGLAAVVEQALLDGLEIDDDEPVFPNVGRSPSPRNAGQEGGARASHH